MRATPVVAALLLLTASPLIAQELPSFESHPIQFRYTGLTLTGRSSLLDTLSAAPASFEDWPLLARVGVGSIVGAGTLGGGTAVLLGVFWLAFCEVRCDEFLSHKFTDTEVTFDAVIAIAASVGFVTGGILCALSTRETGGRRRRANAIIVRWPSQPLGRASFGRRDSV